MNKKIQLSLFFSLFCLCSLLFSCKEAKWTTYLDGVWIIDSILYKGHNIDHCLLINGMSFNKDHSLYLPTAPEHYICSKFIDTVETGKFKTEEISEDSAIIDFNTKNHFFRGRHLLVKRDSSNIIEIKSDSLYLLLSKEGYQ